ncbi:MAG TPA: T9SS type A sorting domain-containing protein [bacterium]|nr:T9SS type A sorting domain-containing protein [bacterium]
MRQRWLAGTLAVGVILLTPSVVWSQIAGRVQGVDGNAISGATVEAWDAYPGGTILASGTSDGSGQFSLGAIAGGQFDLRVWRQVAVSQVPLLLKATHYPVVVRDLPHPITNTVVQLVAVPNVAPSPSVTELNDVDSTTYIGAPIQLGDVIETADGVGAIWGVGRTTGEGGYLVRAYGDVGGTVEDEGFVLSEQIHLRINGLAATPVHGAIFFSGSNQNNVVLAGAASYPGVTLTGPLDANGIAGNSAFIAFEITNSGNVASNYTVDVKLDQPWTVNLQSQKSLPLNLAAGGTATIVAEIVIPPGTPDQDVEVRAHITADAYGPANSGAWTTLAVSTTSDVGSGDGGLLPNSFALAQNYPNPFNAGTNITYSLAQGGLVNLSVCNLLGQTVRTVADGYREAGVHTDVWDGRDDHGNAVPSGIYFSRLSQNGQLQVRKMVLLK